MSDFDAARAAALATGDEGTHKTRAVEEQTERMQEGHAAAEGVDADGEVGKVESLREMLLSTDPGRPLAEVEDPWNPDDGGLNRVYRGFQKMADIDGLPAVLDISIGACEWFWQYQDGFRADDPNGDTSDGDDGREIDFEGVSGA